MPVAKAANPFWRERHLVILIPEKGVASKRQLYSRLVQEQDKRIAAGEDGTHLTPEGISSPPFRRRPDSDYRLHQTVAMTV